MRAAILVPEPRPCKTKIRVKTLAATSGVLVGFELLPSQHAAAATPSNERSLHHKSGGGSLGRQAEQVPHALLLREEVLVVLLVRLGNHRDALDDLDAQFLEGLALGRIVRQQSDPRDT